MASRHQPGGVDSLSRRELMAGGAALGAALLLRRPLPRAAAFPASRTAPRVVVVGAGLAGLSCAYRLRRGGVEAVVYEANPDRLGGRCWTARGFADAQTAEHGGEFINTSHVHIRRLAHELGLELEDRERPIRSRRRLDGRFFFGGEDRGSSELYVGYGLLTRRAASDARRIGSYLYDRAGRAARELDEMTAREWLDLAAPGAGNKLLRDSTAAFTTSEYGLDLGRLSAVTMVGQFEPGGFTSDERFHVRGGNDLIVDGLASRLRDGSIRMGAPLRSLRRNGGGGYELEVGGERRAVRADVVVLALPFTALRRANLRGSGLSARKRRCIEELDMGTNSKLLIQLRRRPGHYDRWSGEYGDDRVYTWDSSLNQRGRAGLLTVYSGGRVGAGYPGRIAHREAPPSLARRQLAAIGRAVPGIEAGFGGSAWLDHWAEDPFVHGSYAAFGPGQYTRWWGFVGEPEGGVHFAGEHTSTAAQGYLEGAVRTGERAAREVLTKLR